MRRAASFNARDDGAQLSLDDLTRACEIAHARGARVYLTFNVLLNPAELRDALLHLSECADRGIDEAIVQVRERSSSSGASFRSWRSTARRRRRDYRRRLSPPPPPPPR
jgi:DNA repair photolyase